MAKIMLVEDDNNLREIYGARLTAEGHTIISAKDGEEALALAVKEKPELIISDIMMPRVSGFDMLDILRNAPETKNTKIIMMTALSQAEDKARADKLGADLYLVKSQVTLEDVAKAVNNILSGENSDGPGGPVNSGEDLPPELSQTPEASSPEPPAPADESPKVEPEQSQAQEEPLTPEVNPIAEGVPAPQVDAAPEPASEALPTPEVQAPEIESPPAEPSTPVEEPSQEAVESSSEPKKIEIVEDSQSEPEDHANEEQKEDVKHEPLEVVLPTPPDESTTLKSPEPEQSSPEQPNQQVAENVGPDLSEVLSEEKVSPQEEPAESNDSAELKVEGLAEAPAESDETPQEETTSNNDSVAEEKSEDAENPLEDKLKKKVIQPINDISQKPDFDALLAQEAAKEPTELPPPQTSITPTVSGPNVDSPSSKPADPKPDGFSSFAL